MSKQLGGMLVYFYSAVAVLLYLDKVTRYMKYLFSFSLLVYLLYFLSQNAGITDFLGISFLRPYVEIRFGWFYVIEPLATSVILVGISYGIKYLNFLRKYDNFSYGLYLFHYPIIQVFVYYGLTDKYPVTFLFITFGCTIVMAYLYFKFWEKPVYDKKLFRILY